MNSILQDLAHPPTRHAMFVHLPIVLAMIGVLLTLLTALIPKNLTLRVLTLVLYAGLVIAAFVTVNSGDRAEAALGAISAEAEQVLNDHENKASVVWLFAATSFVLLALSLFNHKTMRPLATYFALGAGLLTMTWVGQTANLGGALVYRHGLGVPKPPAEPRSPTLSESNVPSGDSALAFFRSEVWPILQENCTRCHNPTRVADGKSGRLDQTAREGLLQGGKSGPAIVPGKPDESLLMTVIRAPDPRNRMPPEPRDPLSQAQIAALEQWIRDGAVWPANIK